MGLGNSRETLRIGVDAIMSENPYVKTLDDELDWKLIDQLHAVVLQISGFCFETKKLCVSVEFIAIALIGTFTKKSIDHSLFVTGLLVPLFFLIVDAIGYYYQIKIRTSMENIRIQIKKRNKSKNIIGNFPNFIEKERSEKSKTSKIITSIFNSSMWLYAIMIGLDIILWLLHIHGVF